MPTRPTPKSRSKSSVIVYHGISPPHPLLPALDVRLGCPRDEHEGRVAGVQMGRGGPPGRPPSSSRGSRRRASRPTPGSKEVAVDDQLTPPCETGRAGSLGRPAQRTRTPSQRPSSASGGAPRAIASRGAEVELLLLHHSSSSRAASHSCGETIGGKFIAPPPSGTRRRHRTGAPRGRAGDPSNPWPRSALPARARADASGPPPRASTTPVSSSTFTCLEMAGFDTPKPAVASPTVAGPCGEALDDATADRMRERSEWIVNH